jgi:hypothetical protein
VVAELDRGIEDAAEACAGGCFGNSRLSKYAGCGELATDGCSQIDAGIGLLRPGNG